MDVTLDFINGLSFGIEYIGKDDENEVDESAVVIDVACVRCIIWLGDFE